jgi:hypothetical protein
VPKDVIPNSRGTTHEKKVSLLESKRFKVLTPNDATTALSTLNLGPTKKKKGYYFSREGHYWTFMATTATTELDKPYRVHIGFAVGASGAHPRRRQHQR